MKLKNWFHEEGEYIFIISSLDFGILGRFCLSFARWVFTLHVYEPIFEGVGFLYKLVDGEAIQTYHWIWMKVFSCRLKVHTSRVLLYIPILSFLFLHSPILTCDGALVGVVIALCRIYSMHNIAYMMYFSVLLCTHSF